MNSRAARLLAVTAIVFGTVAAGGTDVVDKSGKVAVTLPDGWVVGTKAAAASANILLSVKYTAGRPGKLIPIFGVFATSSRLTLDQLATANLALAKTKVPDQGDAGTVTTGKVGGEESRVVVARTIISGHPAEKETVYCRHAGAAYTFDFFCDDAQFAADRGPAEAVLASVRWK